MTKANNKINVHSRIILVFVLFFLLLFVLCLIPVCALFNFGDHKKEKKKRKELYVGSGALSRFFLKGVILLS